MSAIVAIGTAVPPFEHKQKNIAQFMINYLELGRDDERKLNIIYRQSAIEKRYSVLPDFSLHHKEESLFLIDHKKNVPGIEKRMACFEKNALSLAKEAIVNCFNELDSEKTTLNKVTHLITVSCTGMSAPGLEIDLIHSLNLSQSISRTGVNFMGCYAVFHALKIADAVCKADKEAVVLLVSVELCTIHFQNKTDTDNLISNSLFADGAAAALVVSDKKAEENAMKGLHLKSFYSDLANDGKKDMAWQISATGFLMTLSSYIPALIENKIADLTNNLLEKSGIAKDHLDFYAIHPGGRKILEAVEAALDITDNKMEASFDVLKNYGNMSSATILFVLKDLWANKTDWKKAQNIFAVGFGPGLTMESAILQNVNFSIRGFKSSAAASRLVHA